MSSITGKRFLVGMLTAALLVLAGCGDRNSTALYDPETMAHPADWLPLAHSQRAAEDLNSCKSCHGSDLSGGISRVSCTSCHLGGPTAVHPAAWDGQPWYQAGAATEGHGLYVTENGTSACRNIWCHGQNLQGVPASGPSCGECHPGEAF